MISDEGASKRLLQKRDELFGRIPKRPGIIRGTPVKMKRSCGKTGCRCRKDSPHESLYISQSFRGKTRMIYVPKHLEEKAKEWTAEYRRLKGLLDELSELHLKLLAARS